MGLLAGSIKLNVPTGVSFVIEKGAKVELLYSLKTLKGEEFSSPATNANIENSIVIFSQFAKI